MAGAEVAQKRGSRLRLLTLTSARWSTPIARDWTVFVKRVRRLGNFEYFKAKELTKSGYDHLHVVFESKLYLEQAWISRVWKEIHGAPIVDIRLIRNIHAGVAAYVGKYLAKEKGGRYSWSWRWAFHNFVAVWRACKEHYGRERALPGWRRLLSFIAAGGDLADVKWLVSRQIFQGGRVTLV